MKRISNQIDRWPKHGEVLNILKGAGLSEDLLQVGKTSGKLRFKVSALGTRYSPETLANFVNEQLRSLQPAN